MKIVFQHDGILPVIKYGGIERIIYWHMVELVKRGHEVILIGNKDSKVEDQGVKLIPMDSNEWHHLIPKDSDIIHLFFNHKVPGDIPTINTIQGNGKHGEEFLENTVFVSKKHAANHGSDQYIYNGIDFNEYPYTPKTKSFNKFLFLAKGSWSVKNLKHCIKACKKSKKHLHIAGGKSWMPSKFIHNHGMVGGDEKLQIMKECDAFLFPVRWHEPFGIAVIEAMSQGMPVFSSPYGSLPELVQPNVGKVCHNYQELLEEVSCADNKFDPEEIRKYAKDNFCISIHTTKYLEVYDKVIRGEKLNNKKPSWCLKHEAQFLLPY